MTKSDSRHERMKSLLSQDRAIHDQELKEFRMQLDASLLAWEKKGRMIRRVAWFAGSVVVLSCLSILLLEGIATLRNSAAAHIAWAVVTFVSLFVAGACLVWYRDRYVPALQRERFELLGSMIRELQGEVATLRASVQDLGRRDDS